MKRVFLQNNRGFAWYSSANCFAKGYLFDAMGNFYQGKKLLTYFDGIDSFSDLEEKVKYASGVFSVICKADEELFVAIDSIRSFPLFYIRTKGQWLISDNAYFLAETSETRELNNLAVNEFLATGYVTGDETLLEGIRQVQAGEIIHFKEDDLNRKFYFSYRISKAIDEPYEKLRIAGIQVFERAFDRFIGSVQGKTVVVPLSGGYDSRLIATVLKKSGFTDVVCFTYGRKDNPEAEISQKVAENLGFKWYFIEYTDELIRDFVHSDVFLEYYPSGSNLTSMFYLQEYFAVKYLKDHSIISENSVFVPGHSGDFLGGSQLNKHENFSLEESLVDIAERIFRVKYSYFQPDKKEVENLVERIMKNLQEKFVREADYAYSIHEDWDFKEKLAKFNFNSNSIYTFFGYEFRIPYWDRELVEFFQHLPVSAKLNKYLYDDILTSEYFEPYGLNFKNELQPRETDFQKQKVREVIKSTLPPAVTDKLVKKKDNICYLEITELLRSDLEKRGIQFKFFGNKYNSIIIRWYIEDVKIRFGLK